MQLFYHFMLYYRDSQSMSCEQIFSESQKFFNVKLHFITSGSYSTNLRTCSFMTLYICEIRLSTMMGIKTKFRNKLQLSNSLCLKMPHI